MPVTAIYGLPGRGKSLLMLQRGLKLAEKYRLRLVTNFQLDPVQLAYYCKINNFKWLLENMPKGIFYYVSSNKNFAQFLQIQDAVILLDEMGLYAPSCQSWTLPAEAHNAVANNRKRLQHIIYAAQYPTQVHSSIHKICSEVLYAEGVAVWSDKLRNDRLLFKDVHLFKPAEFEVWHGNPRLRKNPIKSMVLAEKHWKGVISADDAQTFRVYDSFGLLEKQDEKVIADQSFGYQPFVIYPDSNKELSIDQIAAEGYSFEELDQKLDEFYQSDRKKRKAIYEASSNNPFTAWKIVGKVPIDGIHPFQSSLITLWQWMPSDTYKGMVKLDMAITKECLTWSKFDDEMKNSYKMMFRLVMTFILCIFSLLVSGFLPRHPFIFFGSYFLAFYLPTHIFK
jgi:hypothetical protein